MTDLHGLLSRLNRLRRRGSIALGDWIAGRRGTRQMVRGGLRVARFERWGIRPISQRRFIDLIERANAAAVVPIAPTPTVVEEPPVLPPLPEIAALRTQLDAAQATIAHLRQVDAQAKAGVQRFVDEVQHLFFATRETTGPSASAATLVAGNMAPADAIATLVNLSDPAHGERAFQYMVPFLATPVPFPLPWPAGAAPIRVVDVGSQELATENDIHAPLRAAAPVAVTGFDPFSTAAPGEPIPREVTRADGGTILTYPYLIADGGPVTFRINRFDATSSTLPTNHVVTRPFGLLDMALETVEEREMPSRRLDDVLTDAVPIDFLKVDVQGASQIVLAHGQAALRRTLVCHVEVEFVPVYAGEKLFAEVDTLLREAGFGFVDFHSLGRQRYAAFENSPARAFHRGRTLWADAVYVRGLDTPGALSPEELRRAALILHCCYNKRDVAAELLGRADAVDGAGLLPRYLGEPA